MRGGLTLTRGLNFFAGNLSARRARRRTGGVWLVSSSTDRLSPTVGSDAELDMWRWVPNSPFMLRLEATAHGLLARDAVASVWGDGGP